MRRWESDFFLRNNPEDAAAYEVDAARVLGELGALARIPEAENAIIEASRGEGAGPGAALVANRINNLANQTTQATERITARIGENHRAAEDAVGAVASIAEIVSDIDYSAAALAAAVGRAGGVSRHAAGLRDQVGKVVETLRGGG